jgi:hypothetical protein
LTGRREHDSVRHVKKRGVAGAWRRRNGKANPLAIHLAVILAAIISGATNNRVLVLGPKTKAASVEVRDAAVAALAMALEKQRLVSRRLQQGNLVDIKGKKLLRDPIGVQLRSLLQAGCEGDVCGATLRAAFSALGAVARVTIKPLGAKGGLVTVWIRGLRSDGSFAPRKSRSAVLTAFTDVSIGPVVTALTTGLHNYKPKPIAGPQVMVIPEIGSTKVEAPKGLTGLAPWRVVADAARKALQAELEEQRAATDERSAKIASEKAEALAKIRAAEEEDSAAAAMASRKKTAARKAAEKARIANWKKSGVGGEVGVRFGPSMVQGTRGVEVMGQAVAIAAQLRVPLGAPGLRLGIGVSGGSLPVHTVKNPETDDEEAWQQLSHPDEASDEPGEEFWYFYEYIRFIQIDGRLDLQFGNAPVGAFIGGGIGLNLSHGQVFNLQFDVDAQGEAIPGTGAPRRDPSDKFTWPALQSSFAGGLWLQAPKVPVTLTIGYRRYTGHLSGLKTMARPVNDENVDRVFDTTMAREIIGIDVTYRF